MSGFNPSIMGAAARHAEQARARAIVAENIKAKGGASPGAAAWARMSERARMVAVSLCIDTADDLTRTALRRWDTFTEAERARLGACVRDLGREFAVGQALR